MFRRHIHGVAGSDECGVVFCGLQCDVRLQCALAVRVSLANRYITTLHINSTYCMNTRGDTGSLRKLLICNGRTLATKRRPAGKWQLEAKRTALRIADKYFTQPYDQGAVSSRNEIRVHYGIESPCQPFRRLAASSKIFPKISQADSCLTKMDLRSEPRTEPTLFEMATAGRRWSEEIALGTCAGYFFCVIEWW
jgi:hypothetical protein